MSWIIVVAALALGVLGCQPERVLPGGAPDPTIPATSQPKPSGPSTTIEVPPPIN